MLTAITPPSSLVAPVATNPVQDKSSGNNSTPVDAKSPLNLDPPKAEKIATPLANYQSRWEREKAKARADGTEIDSHGPKMIGPWVIGEMLGRGASGRVKLARHATTGKMAAVKILNLHPSLSSRSSNMTSAGAKAEKMLLAAEREIAVMKLLDHPNIMKMYDVWSSPNELYLVLEYVQGGELFDYLCSRGSRLPLLEAVSIIKQIFAAVNYCHRFNICHRDLKPENILLIDETVTIPGSTQTTSIKHVKVADFGMSTLDSLNGLLRTSCGSPHYASPEIVRGHLYSGASSDIWSCGVILFALITSRLPFDDPNVNNVLRKVKDGRFTIPDWVIPEARDLITRILEVDCSKRITMREIFSHPLMRMDTPGIILPPAPRLDELALPVAKKDVDSDLLRNLCIIWREKDKMAMLERLCSEEKNFEKAFYFLLCRYRDRSFEEYNMDFTPPPMSNPTAPPGIATLLIPLPTPLPTPVYNEFHPNQIASPIKRHYPGKPVPRGVANLKKGAQDLPSTRAGGSPVRSKGRDVEKKQTTNSPRKSRVLSNPSLAANSPRKASTSSESPRKSNLTRSRASTLHKSKGEDQHASAVGGGDNGGKGPIPARVAPVSPVKAVSTTSGSKASPKRVPATSQSKVSPKKPHGLASGTVVPRNSPTSSASRSCQTPVVHRRALSASAAVSSRRASIDVTMGINAWNTGRGSEATATPTFDGMPQGATAEKRVAHLAATPTRSPVIVPTGIVQQRTSLLTSKLIAMGAKPSSANESAVHPIPVSVPAKASDPLVAPSGPPTGFLMDQPTSTRTQRVPSGGFSTPARPLSHMISSPTVFSSEPPRARHSTETSTPSVATRWHRYDKTGISAQTPNRATHEQSSRSSRSTPVHIPSRTSRSNHISSHLCTPSRTGRTSSMLETPSKSPRNNFLGSPNRIRGLGFFVSPGKSAKPSPSKSNTREASKALAMDDDPTPKASVLNPKSHAGSKRPLSVFGIPEEDGDEMGQVHHVKQLDVGALIEKPKHVAARNAENSVAKEVTDLAIHRNSGSSASMSCGRASNETGFSSSEAWEKIDWSGDAISGIPDAPAKGALRPKKRPAPLDLFNPYHKDRRSRVPLSSGSAVPLENHRQSHSPMAVLSGFSWAGGSSTPPTPALIGSSGMESDPSSGSSQVVVSTSGVNRGFFAKLFDWKAPVLSLVSTENPVATREECARLLRCLNVTFVPSETGGFSCCADDIIDSNGTHITKSVNFRVEIEVISSSRPVTPSFVGSPSFIANERSPVPGSHSQRSTGLDLVASPRKMLSKQDHTHAEAHGAQVVCNVNLIQEKGAQSTLRVVYQKMQESWRFNRSNVLMHNPPALHHPITPVSARGPSFSDDAYLSV